MRLGTVLERFVVVQPDEKEILVFADKPAPQLTRSQIVEYCKVRKHTVPDYELQFGAEAFGLWGHTGDTRVWQGAGGGCYEERVGYYGGLVFWYTGSLSLYRWVQDVTH